MADKIIIGPRKKIAYVCSGGAAKAAAFHMGASLALQEKGFHFIGGLKKESKIKRAPHKWGINTYVGSSAGSVISCYLAAGYTVEQIFKAYLGKSKEKSPLKPISYGHLISVKASQHEDKSSFTKKLRGLTSNALDLLYRRQRLLSMSGLFTTAGIESYMRESVLPSNNFKDYVADLHVVATQLNHSKRIIFNKYILPSPPDDPGCIYDNTVNISDAVAASTALPPIFSPYAIRNHNGKIIYFFDGEIRETLSMNAAEDAGADLIIASHTHQPYHFSREIGSLTKFGLPSICIQAIYLLIERKIQTARYERQQSKAALDAVREYCIEQGISDIQRKRICGILEEKLAVKSDTHYIYIHPRPHDHEMFFGEHFNFSEKFMEKIVRIGFMSTIDALRRYEFRD